MLRGIQHNIASWQGFVIAVLVLGLCGALQAREVELEILHTADLNGCLLDEEHGLLACAGYIQDRRYHNPNLLLVDCGDSVGPSIASCWKNGKLIRDTMAALPYDVRIPGDMDWRFGMVDAASMICANVRGPAVADWAPVLMREVDGVKVAFIGLTMPAVALYTLPAERRGVEYISSLDALRMVMPRVRQMNPDIIVLVAHQGCLLFDDGENQLNAVIKHFPEIDVVLGGHTRQTAHGRRVGETLYAQAGSDGHGVGRVDLRFDTVTRQVQSRGVYVPVNKALPRQQLGEEFVENCKSMQRYASVPLGTVSSPVTWGQLTADALSEAFEADAVLLPMLDRKVPVGEPITMDFLCQNVPNERVGVLDLTAGELEDVMEEGWHDRKRTLSLTGLRCRINQKGSKGHRVLAVLTPTGESPHPRKQFRVVCPASLLASNGGQLGQLRKLANTPTTTMMLQKKRMHDVLSSHIREHYVR